ncbi:hypothetical protein Drorol1_Dr00004224 [Drosera rotundifolia]
MEVYRERSSCEGVVTVVNFSRGSSGGAVMGVLTIMASGTEEALEHGWFLCAYSLGDFVGFENLGLLRLLFGDFDGVKMAVEAAGLVDVLVCNHGMPFPQKLDEQDIHEMKLGGVLADATSHNRERFPWHQ